MLRGGATGRVRARPALNGVGAGLGRARPAFNGVRAGPVWGRAGLALNGPWNYLAQKIYLDGLM
jgi:hypothetical protein